MNFPYLISPECTAESEDMPTWIYLPYPIVYHSFNAIELNFNPIIQKSHRINEFGRETKQVIGFMRRFYNALLTFPDIMFTDEELVVMEKINRN